MFSRPKILFLVSLLFVALLNSIPTYLLNFKFFIILVCLLLYMLSIHNNLSAGAQMLQALMLNISKRFNEQCVLEQNHPVATRATEITK